MSVGDCACFTRDRIWHVLIISRGRNLSEIDVDGREVFDAAACISKYPLPVRGGNKPPSFAPLRGPLSLARSSEATPPLPEANPALKESRRSPEVGGVPQASTGGGGLLVGVLFPMLPPPSNGAEVCLSSASVEWLAGSFRGPTLVLCVERCCASPAGAMVVTATPRSGPSAAASAVSMRGSYHAWKSVCILALKIFGDVYIRREGISRSMTGHSVYTQFQVSVREDRHRKFEGVPHSGKYVGSRYAKTGGLTGYRCAYPQGENKKEAEVVLIQCLKAVESA